MSATCFDSLCSIFKEKYCNVHKYLLILRLLERVTSIVYVHSVGKLKTYFPYENVQNGKLRDFEVVFEKYRYSKCRLSEVTHSSRQPHNKFTWS